MIIAASPGESISFSTRFLKQNGAALTGSSAATWIIKNHNGVSVVSGTGTQDLLDSALWRSSATIPSSAPITSGDEAWTVVWRLPLSNGESAYFTEPFSIRPSGDASVAQRPTNVLVLADTDLVDSIPLPPSVSTPTFTIKSENGTVLATLTPTGAVSGDDKIWTVSGGASVMKVPTGNAGYLLGMWNWTNSLGNTETEVHPIYVLNGYAMTLVTNLRKFVDKAQLSDIHPHLSFTDMDLLHYIHRGISYCNAIGPVITYWNINTLPAALTHFIEMAAALNALQSQYLAEGMTAFDFQGLGVQLTVDRTQYLDNIANQLTALLDKLPDSKKAWVAAGSPIITGSGIQTNRVIAASVTSYFAANRPTRMPVAPLGSHGYLIGTLPEGFWGDGITWSYFGR